MKKGFTLVELLVVVAILGVLAAVGILSFGGFLGNAKKKSSSSIHSQVVKFIETSIIKCSYQTNVYIPSCNACITEGAPYGGDPHDSSICNGTPLTNMNWIFAGYFITAGFKNPFDTSLVATDSGNCGHGESCIKNPKILGTTYIDVENQVCESGYICRGNLVVRTKVSDSEVLETKIYIDMRDY